MTTRRQGGAPAWTDPYWQGPRTDFVIESNRIEGINRPPRQAELDAHRTLWDLDTLEVADLEQFVAFVAPHARLRRHAGMDIRVGDHRPQPGGPAVEGDLRQLLLSIHVGALTPYEAHCRYEHLHPFQDGNGRSGRALWAWHMQRVGMDPFALAFLHRHYYQSLDAWRAT